MDKHILAGELLKVAKELVGKNLDRTASNYYLGTGQHFDDRVFFITDDVIEQYEKAKKLIESVDEAKISLAKVAKKFVKEASKQVGKSFKSREHENEILVNLEDCQKLQLLTLGLMT